MKFSISVIFSVIFSLLIIGCGANLYEYTSVSAVDHVNNKRVIEVWTTNNFNESEEGALNGALEEWNNVFNGQIELKTAGTVSSVSVDDWEEKFREVRGTGDGWLLIKLDSDNELIEGDVGRGTLAFVPGLGSSLMFILGDRIGTKNLKTIMMHEMGHMMGASHVNMDYTLMTPMYGFKQVDCIDLITVRQVAWYYDLEIKTMNYCVVPKE